MRRWALTFALLSTGALIGSCAAPSGRAQPEASAAEAAPEPIPLPSPADEKPRGYAGIHNVVAYADGFVSGGAPEGDAGFGTLAAMGVKTIISVDGAEPEVARAAARGMRYIHLPIGYNGFDEQRKLQLVRAVRDARNAGPVYIHCHHGKHRSAAAAATIAVCLGWSDAEQGVARMRVSGTAENYKGLYACAGGARLVAATDIDRVAADFPSVWKPDGFVQSMIEIDAALDNLKAIEKAAWQTPAEHPDLVPAAEAGRLADLLRLVEASEYSQRKPAEFAAAVHNSQQQADELERMLADGQTTPKSELSARLKLVAATCRDCHGRYRD
ncbi:MAG: cytochrome c [Planctomycetes bacterium]|nr:cytochrome c [Planctomycetota bacterium]